MIKGEMMSRRRSCERQESQTCSCGLGQASDSIRSHLSLCNQGTFPRCGLSPQTHNSPHSCLPSPTLSSFPLFLTYINLAPHRSPFRPISPFPPEYPPLHSFSQWTIPWIRRHRKQMLFFPVVLPRSHSTVLDHCGELLATRLDLQAHPLVTRRIVPVAVIASLVVHQQRPSFRRSPA